MQNWRSPVQLNLKIQLDRQMTNELKRAPLKKWIASTDETPNLVQIALKQI